MVLAELAGTGTVRGGGGLAGSLLAVEPAATLAREGELEETRAGLLTARARELLERAYPRPALPQAAAKDQLDHLIRALVAAELLVRVGPRLIPGPALPIFRAASGPEKALVLLRGYEIGTPPLGGSPPAGLAEITRREVTALEGPVPADLPVRLALLRWTQVPAAERASHAVPLEDAVALAWEAVVPAAEATGLVTLERDARGAPVRLVPTVLLRSLRSAEAAPAERSVIVASDGEAIVLPGPGAAAGALLLGRLGELVSPGDSLRYRVTAATVGAAHAAGCDLDVSLAELRRLARGEVPLAFERLLRDAASASVRARARVLHVLEVPRAGAADRAARILGALLIDRLTPTVLVVAGPLPLAMRRALAREGVFVEDS